MRRQIAEKISFLFLGLFTLGLFLVVAKPAEATGPNLINFQGKVVNADETNVADNSYTFRFCLYTTATPATPCTASADNDAVWRESKSLSTTDSIFQTELGDTTTLPDFNTYPTLYLGVTFNNDSDGEMTPRIHLDSVPYARNADALGGLSASAFAQLSATNAFTNTNSITVASSTAFQVINGSSKEVLTVDTSANKLLLGKLGSSGLNGALTFNTATASNYQVGLTVSGSTTGSYTLTLPTAAPGGNNYCLQSSTGGALSWAPCGGSGTTRTMTLSPEFAGAVLTGDGGSNTGTMTSDFCSGSSRQNLNTSVCTGSTESHNYYDWTSTGANDYDIWVRWQVPSDFSSFSSGSFYGWKTASGDSVTMNVYNNSASTCATQATSATTGSWQSNSITMTSCTPSAGDVLTIDIHLAVASSGNHARVGEITLTYNRL